MADNPAEMGLTPEDMGMKTGAEIHREIDPETFGPLKIRVEKSQRIKEGIRPGGNKPFDQARVDEIRDLERNVNLRERRPDTIEQDMQLDSRGFQAQIYPVSYKTPDGQILKERVVMFVKPGENGEFEFMKDSQGRTMAINSDLFDSKLKSDIHAQGMDYDTFTIPRVDGRGAFSGIITLRTDKKQPGQTELAAGTPQQTSQPEATVAPKENPLDSIRPILDRLKTPGQSNTEPIRLGKEVVLSGDEIAALQDLINQTSTQLAANPELRNLQQLIQQQSKETAFGIAKFFGNAVVEDNRVSSPQVVTEPGGPKIHVPAELFSLWQRSNNLSNANSSLEEYKTQGYQGRLASTLATLIENGLIQNP